MRVACVAAAVQPEPNAAARGEANYNPFVTERDPKSFEPWIVEADRKAWKGFADAPGVEYKVLRKHPQDGGLTLLLRFAKGVRYPAHRHPGGEEYYMLDGTLRGNPDLYPSPEAQKRLHLPKALSQKALKMWTQAWDRAKGVR